MTEATQPWMARGTKLPAAIVATALFALLAFAPLASATPDPVASGSTTITLNKGWTKYLKTFGIKIQKISPAKVKGQKATFTVNGGEMDPTNGLGTLTLAGGLKFKAGKKTATVKGLVLDTGKSVLTGKVSGKKVKLANLSGLSYARNGFGVNVSLKKMKLNSAGAKQLNKKLGFAKGKPKPFIGGKVMGKSSSESQPTTVAIIPGGNVSFNANQELLLKLKDVETEAKVVAPTTEKGLGNFELPISGGSIAPTATAGQVQTSGGIVLAQKLPTGPSSALETEITLGNMWLDFSAKTVTVEVIAKSNASNSLNLGNLGRSSIADLTLTGATVSSDSTARTVTVKDASATLQPISAEVLEGFVKVYQAYYRAGVCASLPNKCESAIPAEKEAEEKFANEAAAKKVEKDHIAAGNPLGSFSFTAQTQ
jgi:Htaa protein